MVAITIMHLTELHGAPSRPTQAQRQSWEGKVWCPPETRLREECQPFYQLVLGGQKVWGDISEGWSSQGSCGVSPHAA